jgi:hypothetical protein
MNKPVDEEDRPIRTFRQNSADSENEISELSSAPSSSQSSRDPLPLNELIQDVKLLETVLDVFPEDFVVTCITPGSRYQDQEECMKRLLTWLQQVSDLPKGFVIFPSVTLPIEKVIY